MISSKEMTKILLNSQDLYDECGDLFKYLAEVRINFSSLKAHNVPWQLSQIVEIMASSKLDELDLQLEDVILNYCYNIRENSEAKKAVISSFKAVFLITKLRNDEKKVDLDFSDIKSLLDIHKKTRKTVDDIKNSLSETDAKILLLLINDNFSNNPLYFFPLYLELLERLLQNFPLSYSAKSSLINLYLIKNKLLFAPSICFSYPLLNSFKKYKKLLGAIQQNPKAIIDFSRFTFDLIKQASVVSRAFISDIANIKEKLERISLQGSNKKILNEKNKLWILKSIIFEHSNELGLNETRTDVITKFLIKNNLLSEITTYRNETIYMFSEYVKTFHKLLRNKSEKTTKIFTLNENLS